MDDAESAIVEAMLRWAKAQERGDDYAMADALMEAQELALQLHQERYPDDERVEGEPSEEKGP